MIFRPCSNGIFGVYPTDFTFEMSGTLLFVPAFSFDLNFGEIFFPEISDNKSIRSKIELSKSFPILKILSLCESSL